MSDNIISKINKLMALAEKAGTPEEAELAFAKAQELMVKHAIDQAMLRKDGPLADEPIVVRGVHLGYRDEIVKSKILLYIYVAHANQCRLIDATKGWDEVRIVGHKSSVEFVELLVANILIQYAGARTRAWKEYQATTPQHLRISRFKWVNGFSWGYARRIGERIKETTSKVAASSGKGELALRDKSAVVEDWMNQNMNVRSSTLKKSADFRAQMQGRSAAERADISGGRNNVGTRTGRAIGR